MGGWKCEKILTFPHLLSIYSESAGIGQKAAKKKFEKLLHVAAKFINFAPRNERHTSLNSTG